MSAALTGIAVVAAIGAREAASRVRPARRFQDVAVARPGLFDGVRTIREADRATRPAAPGGVVGATLDELRAALRRLHVPDAIASVIVAKVQQRGMDKLHEALVETGLPASVVAAIEAALVSDQPEDVARSAAAAEAARLCREQGLDAAACSVVQAAISGDEDALKAAIAAGGMAAAAGACAATGVGAAAAGLCGLVGGALAGWAADKLLRDRIDLFGWGTAPGLTRVIANRVSELRPGEALIPGGVFILGSGGQYWDGAPRSIRDLPSSRAVAVLCERRPVASRPRDPRIPIHWERCAVWDSQGHGMQAKAYDGRVVRLPDSAPYSVAHAPAFYLRKDA